MQDEQHWADPDPQMPLRGGQRLVVRPVTADDAAGLEALYDGLDADDRNMRFFGSFRPPPDFIERAVTVAGRGGARLVAVVIDDVSHEQHVVGEAGFTILPDGNGELGMTVMREWRSWLAPRLFDALAATAASYGVPNLETDVLTVDHAMVEMLRRRGARTIGHTGWSAARLLIGTSKTTLTLPGMRPEGPVLASQPTV